MDAYTLIMLILIGLVAGILGGLLGLGGGIIIIPALVFLLGFSQHQSIGTSLAVMLPPIGIFAAYNYYNAGYVNLKYALIVAVAFMAGSWLSSKFALSLSESTLRKIFSFLLLFMAIKMFFTK
ncbi:MAG TPA: sulfite exporter TauE/SafE family protein [Bacteroidales bacterium]|nr:sulfite exporter TauE/SafE family protein [Bacteroidales bacterium]HPT11824.1 sulfite exporter TauE/SafE family protein [Bacteroidales bacterium]